MVTFNDFKIMTKCNNFLNISGGWATRPSPAPGMTTVKFVKFLLQDGSLELGREK